MLVMCYDIRIGNYKLGVLDSVKILKSVENLADTATIVLPATYKGSIIDVESKINKGDAVTISLGYNDNLREEFSGYVRTIETNDNSISIQCEDELYKWEVSVPNKQYDHVSIKDILGYVASSVSAEYKVDCDYDMSYKKFTIFHAYATDVLKKIQDDTKANIYFEGKTLHVHPQYAQVPSTAVKFDFARNIESNNLKYVKAADQKVEVEVILVKPDGKSKKEKYGQEGGKKIQKTVAGIDESSMIKAAENEYNLWVYDGYEGDFTTWLVPYVEPTYKVSLHDEELPSRDGTYYVLGTETEFSQGGGVRKITLGRKL